MTDLQLAIFFLRNDYREYLLDTQEYYRAGYVDVDEAVDAYIKCLQVHGLYIIHAIISAKYFPELTLIFPETNE